MDNHSMASGKAAAAAAAVGLGVGAALLLQGGEHLDLAPSPYSAWRQPGRLGAVVCVLAGASVLAALWLYRLIFCALELRRAPEDVGYIPEAGRTRAQAANEVRRRRKAGDVPPVYPNGWYRVLDSHMLHRGEVKNVSALGTV